MTTPLYCLIGFVLWTAVLVCSVGLVRCILVLKGKKRSNEFPSGSQHGGDTYWRANRAHVNCVENLPLFAAVVLTATVIGIDTPAFGTMASVYLVARVCQSLVHIASGTALAVNVRFAFFLTQLLVLFLMISDLLFPTAVIAI